MWRAVELEAIARQYHLSLCIGGPVLLTDAEIAETAQGFTSYGVQDDYKDIAAGTPKEKKQA
jgi:L-fuculose-phosphate aldolase